MGNVVLLIYQQVLRHHGCGFLEMKFLYFTKPKQLILFKCGETYNINLQLPMPMAATAPQNRPLH